MVVYSYLSHEHVTRLRYRLVHHQGPGRHPGPAAQAVSYRERYPGDRDAHPRGILLKPVTRHAIDRLRGILKRKPGAPPLAEEWAEHKREEKELENRKYARSTGTR